MLNALQDNALPIFGFLALVIAVGFFLAALAIIRRSGITQRHSPASDRVFEQAIGIASREAYVLYDMRSHRVQYASESIQRILGIRPSVVLADVHALARGIEHDSVLDLREGVAQWDRRQPFVAEFRIADAPNARLVPLPKDEQSSPSDEPPPARWGELRIASAGNGRLLISLTDITERRELYHELVEQREQAQNRERAKLVFLSNMSHEIRTPMNGIMGTLSLASHHLDDEERTRAYLAQADDLLKYLLSIINDVLDISKIDNEKLEVEERCFDITNVLRSEDRLFREMITSKGIEFPITLDELPTPYIIGDELRLTQVVTNLISNSYKFTDAGGTISLSLKFMQITDNRLHVCISVTDTGKGMSPDFLKDIFNPFSQEDRSTSRRFGGTGLGMAISDQLTRLMGGHITVESELGVGTTFEIHLGLPIASEEQIAGYLEAGGPGLAGENSLNPDVAFKLEGSKILFAEDNMINAMLAIDMLQELGASIDHAKDGAIACEMFAMSDPYYYDIILMDVQMPNMNGWEAAQKIRQMNRADAQTVLIFAQSADAYVEDKRHSREVGMDGHLSKPLKLEQLESLINAELALAAEGSTSHAE